MRIYRTVIIATMLIYLSGCYAGITGHVVDAETQRPIEGAIVLVEWTKKHGFGDAWTESYKVVETISDKEGNVKIAGCYSPFVEHPDVTVYKKGYVAWSSRWIFPDNRNRTDFKWSYRIFKLEHFKNEYSYNAHTSFIALSINSSLEKNYELKKSIFHAIEWEQDLAFQERLRKKQQ
jgi:hypothetical protein